MRIPQNAQKIVLLIYGIICLVSIVIVTIDVGNGNAGRHKTAWISAGVFCMATLPIILWLIVGHMIYFTKPTLQRYLIRISLMVPIYSVDAWIALRFPTVAIYMDTVRECYEAYVIYSFMFYLLAYLNEAYVDFGLHLRVKPQVKHVLPFCWLPDWKMGETMLNRCKHGVLQYTVVRPVATVLALIFEFSGVYHEGDFSFLNGWSYIVVINNVSQIWALYCLVMFYQAAKEELAPVKPIWKFGCVKAVVFLAFWQGVLLAILVKVGVISETIVDFNFTTVEQVANGLQDWIICLEMFLLAFAFLYAFNYKPFIPEQTNIRSDAKRFTSAVPAVFDVSDVRSDVQNHLAAVRKTFSTLPRLSRRHNATETHPLISHNRTEAVPTAYLQLNPISSEPSSSAV